MEVRLGAPCILPCGAKIKNRLAKAAMSENMADEKRGAGENFKRLYQAWAKGGAGLLITGNVMCDRRFLGEPHNVVVEKNGVDMKQLKEWAQAGSADGTHLWMQINHPGRQSPKFLSKTPLAPSALPLKAPLDRLFNPPRAMSENEIKEVIGRFADAAEIARDAGFTGVQIHGAHGYLVAQFLSPLSNQRTDEWGGSLQNRMRFVLEIYRAIRGRVGALFPIGIKLNSADFQRGGFGEEDALAVMKTLDEEGIDLFEISGGSYEAPVMVEGVSNKSASTIAREAYFLDFARLAKKSIKAPLMVTGGFRSAQAMNAALRAHDLDIVGLARSLALDPHFPDKLLRGEDGVSLVHPLTSRIGWLDKLVPLEIVWYTHQLHRMGKGLPPEPKALVIKAILRTLMDLGWQSLRPVRSGKKVP